MKTAIPVLFLAALGFAASAAADPLPRNWPSSPHDLEHRFEKQDFVITEVKGAGSGVTGASKLKVWFPDGKTMKIKWKAVPDASLDGWNNSPRKELASYAIQSLFLDENDFVVPTSAPRCLPMETYRSISSLAKPSLEGTKCVLGVISVWMNDVDAPEHFYDKARFARDPLYARDLADFNLLTYLVDHRDGRRGNLLLSTDANDPRSYAVDNGIAFSPFPWNFLVPNWDKLRVPWLRKQSVDRLRSVDKARLAKLGVVDELVVDENGILRMTAPTANLNPRKGARYKDGRVQFGLEKDEIEDVKERIEALLKRVDSGKLPVR